MMGKVALLVGLGAGYVLGARAGRERYEQLKGTATSLWQDPAVQHRVEQATHAAATKVKGDDDSPDASTQSTQSTASATSTPGTSAGSTVPPPPGALG